MTPANQFIQTKLRLPFTRTGLVSRPRLQDQIEEGIRGPLTLITAPAGFGKTTLVASSVAKHEKSVAWLSLDKDDNQAMRFLRYVIAALQVTDPKIGEEASQLAVQHALVEAILTSLINSLDGMGKDIILVLDDYQFMHNQDIHAAVTFLLEHCPLNFHLVIATRADPLLPLSRLRARGQVVEVRASDLRFTAEEAAQFLNDVMGLHLDAESVRLLEERTEGWIAGLQMTALSIRNRTDTIQFIESFSGTNRYIMDYLLEEVLASQPYEVQQFLLYTSILERLTAPLCDSLIGMGETEPDGYTTLSASALDSHSVLEYLERANLFLIPLDEERYWYRYHHLFADLLRSRLLQEQPERIPILHQLAASWLEEKGLITDSIHHLLAAQEIEHAADMIETYGPVFVAQGDPSVFQLADNLPAQMLVTRPYIGIYLAWYLIVRGQIQKAVPLLIELARNLNDTADGSEKRWIDAIIKAALAFLAPPGNDPSSFPLPEVEEIDEIPASEAILRNAADYLFGMALARRGELDRAVEVAVKCIEREKQQMGTGAIPTLAPFLSRVYLMMGRLSAAAALCCEFLDPIREKGIHFVYTSGSMKTDLGEVLSERNCLEEAEQMIREGLRGNEPWQNIMSHGFGHIALARLLLSKGDFSGAAEVIDKFEARLKSSSIPREFFEDFHSLRARWMIASGDIRSASQWADRIQGSEDYQLHREQYQLVLAHIRLMQGKYVEVEDILTGVTPSITSGSQVSRHIECLLLLAAAAAGCNQMNKAMQYFESSLVLAESEGHFRVFNDVGEPARELLRAYLRSEDPGHHEFAQKVLEAFTQRAQVGSNTTEQPGLIEPLTVREIEVLQLMSLGKSNQEIAQQLVVSPGTVKAHTANIYRKLDVANRTEAVTNARQRGIIP